MQAVAAQVEAADMDELLAISDRVKQALGDGAAVVLGAAVDGKALLVANLGPGAVAAGPVGRRHHPRGRPDRGRRRWRQGRDGARRAARTPRASRGPGARPGSILATPRGA